MIRNNLTYCLKVFYTVVVCCIEAVCQGRILALTLDLAIALNQKIAAVALGSNLGDSHATLEAALAALSKIPGVSLQARSHWYRTVALGPPQPEYLNGCVLLQVLLSPQDLLTKLLTIETKLGRVRRQRWGPRSLDLDLLLYDDLILNTPTLQLPHPRMRERAFVLVPLAEIAPNLQEPVSGNTIAQLVQAVDCRGVCRANLHPQRFLYDP